MILLKMNKTLYENDVRALIMAFFPGERISTTENEGYTHLVQIQYDEDEIVVRCQGNVKYCLCDYNDYKGTRNILKRTVYTLLSECTGKDLPWGTLTGIRPTKIPMQFYEEGKSSRAVVEHLKKTYYTSDEKCHLCLEVARNEKKILDSMDYDNSYSLYVGIPFCPTICLYCSFSSYELGTWKDKVDDYLEALFKEIDAVSQKVKGRKMLTFYMGGGTPTSLTAEQMDRLLKKLHESFDIESALEKTIEAGRPDSITKEKLEVIKKYGIDRISINPQTMNQETLDIIGRKHRVEQVKDSFALTREVGFKNINMDIIVGLPGEDAVDVKRTLKELAAMDPDSMTVHALAIKRASRLNENLSKYPPASVEDVEEMISMSLKAARKMGMEPYYLYRQKNIAGNMENVGYAKPGKEGAYNILIMEEKQSIIALGAGASTKIVYPKENRIERIENVKSVKDYIERIDEMIERKREKL